MISFSGLGHRRAGRDGPGQRPHLDARDALLPLPSNCHTAPDPELRPASRRAFNAPDHEYPSYLELEADRHRLGGARDGHAAARTRRRSISTSRRSPPASRSPSAPEQRGAVHAHRDPGSTNTLIAPRRRRSAARSTTSRPGPTAAAHTITAPHDHAGDLHAPTTPRRLLAADLVGAWGFDETSGPTVSDNPATATPARSPAPRGRRPADSARRSRSTASTTWSPCPTRRST